MKAFSSYLGGTAFFIAGILLVLAAVGAVGYGVVMVYALCVSAVPVPLALLGAGLALCAGLLGIACVVRFMAHPMLENAKALWQTGRDGY